MSDLSTRTSDFVGRIAVAVWVGRLTDEAAREALHAYATAWRPSGHADAASMHEAILAEYRHRRDGHDMCS
jgi:hypothetical protein